MGVLGVWRRGAGVAGTGVEGGGRERSSLNPLSETDRKSLFEHKPPSQDENAITNAQFDYFVSLVPGLDPAPKGDPDKLGFSSEMELGTSMTPYNRCPRAAK